VSDVAHDVDLSTGAWNRRRFEVALANAVHQAHRAGEPLSLVYVDIDELQEQNDLHGKAELDEVISELASLIAREVNGAGPIGRVDGDAFAIFLKVPLRSAVEVAERIRRSAGAASAVARTLRVTVSAGVAQLRKGEPWGNLLDAAEDACTRAKQHGRNSVAAR